MALSTGLPIQTVKAWDWPTRAFHWLLVVLIFDAWLSINYDGLVGDTTLLWHRLNGYAILILLVFRVLWGFVGSSTSRFSAFIQWPGAALRYGRALIGGVTPRYLGHNPLGTWMILMLLLAVLVQLGLGLFALDSDGLLGGPLALLVSDDTAKTLGKRHKQFFNVLLALIAIHVTANSLYWLIKKDPLISGMISGKKPAAAYVDEREASIAPNVSLRALLCLVVAAGLVLGGILAASGQL